MTTEDQYEYYDRMRAERERAQDALEEIIKMMEKWYTPSELLGPHEHSGRTVNQLIYRAAKRGLGEDV